MIELLYAGFDKFDVSFQGALPFDSLKELTEAKKRAVETQERQLVKVGNLEAHILKSGQQGGYAFVLDTGPLGELWTFKENLDARQWNIGVSVHASALATYGYYDTKKRIINSLHQMGCIIGRESVRRLDFAMDFLMPENFELNIGQVVAHSRTKVTPHWSDCEDDQGDVNKPSAVLRGRKFETITIGKMPGRQVTIYNKRKAVIEQKKLFWFKVWKIDPNDKSKKIWRVELRAGKKELKNKWRISTFRQVEEAIGDVFAYAAEGVRYVDEFQSDQNTTRQSLHPLWLGVMGTLKKNLFDFQSGLLPNQVIEVLREQQRETYLQQIKGNAVGYAVALGLGNSEACEKLPEVVANELGGYIKFGHTEFTKNLNSKREKFKFVCGPEIYLDNSW